MLYSNRMNHAACPGLAHIAFKNGTIPDEYDDTDHIDGMAKSIFYIVFIEFFILTGGVMYVAAKNAKPDFNLKLTDNSSYAVAGRG